MDSSVLSPVLPAQRILLINGVEQQEMAEGREPLRKPYMPRDNEVSSIFATVQHSFAEYWERLFQGSNIEGE